MDKESLILARNLIIQTLENGDFKNKKDKVELMLNLWILLDEKNYDKGIEDMKKGRYK